MSTATLPALPERPVQPPALRQLIEHANAITARGKRALRAGDFGTFADSVRDRLRLDGIITSWFATPDGVAYNRAAEEFNTALAARDAWRGAEAQARANAAEVATVRAGMCGRCFSSHAGEC